MQADVLDACPVWTNLRTFDGRPWRGLLDIVFGGIPCQPHSVAGKRLGEADERNLWPDTLRIVRESEPAYVWLENVGGAAGFFAARVKPDLETMGYRVEAGLFTAAEVGASHKRERLFLLAYAQCSGRRQVEQPGTRTPETGQLERGGVFVLDNTQDTDRRNGSAGTESGAGCRRGGLGSAGTILADAGGDKGQQERSSIRCDNGPECETAERSGLPLFPPGPADLDAWRRVLKIDPSLEPAICRVADGLASRVDQLRVLGNGVVPLQAAYAFCALLADLRSEP
jgi:DNA (cytosine-5)-methyltransferase 1